MSSPRQENKQAVPKLNLNTYKHILGFLSTKELGKLFRVSKEWSNNTKTVFEDEFFYVTGNPIQIADMINPSGMTKVKLKNQISMDEIKRSFPQDIDDKKQSENADDNKSENTVEIKSEASIDKNIVKLFPTEQAAIEYSRFQRKLIGMDEIMVQPAIFKVRCKTLKDRSQTSETLNISHVHIPLTLRESKVTFFKADIKNILPISAVLKVGVPCDFFPAPGKFISEPIVEYPKKSTKSNCLIM